MNIVFRDNGPTRAIVESLTGDTKTIYVQSSRKMLKQCYKQAFRITIARRNARGVSNPELHDDRRYGLISGLVDSYPDKVALRNQVMQLLVAAPCHWT